MTALSHRRKADRQKMAAAITALAERYGATVAITDPAPLSPRDIWVKIEHGHAHVTIDIDGDDRESVWLTPWNVHHQSDVRFSPAFGAATCAEVNPFHRRKCMGYAQTFDELLFQLERSLACLAAGEAFEQREQAA